MSTIRDSRISSRLRFLALLQSACLLLWLPSEDTHVGWVVLFAIAISAWFATRQLAHFQSGIHQTELGENPLPFLWRYSITGLFAGLAVSPLAVFLMVFKTGLHGHGVPDFSLPQILDVLYRTPFYGLSGLLLGLGIGMWRVR